MLVQVAEIFNETAQQTFMGGLDFHGVTYNLFSHGFWNGVHYWTKILKDIGGISGVWIHNNRQNGGIAWLISPDHSTLAGPAPHTSWVFYSQPWTPSEEECVVESTAKISRDNKGAWALMPFAHLGKLLNTPSDPVPPRINVMDVADKEKIAFGGKPVDNAEVTPMIGSLTSQTQTHVSTTSGILKWKPSGEFRIRLKCPKAHNGQQTTGDGQKVGVQEETHKVSMKVEVDQDQLVSGKKTSKKTIQPKKNDSPPKPKNIKPCRAGIRASTRKAASQML
ncbi:uncharacterized protein PGTG_00798 [Puccinia graminis f. sp. tritici CRL 75-36-700-3]|uniref:Uncharacterized protein n=1 Tax=Puccinia graminis f. sp. tritici (strain CRL 75-36-700-3 / race SCCL) TaxID=418459 RepID=E3JTV8_PUCGT|nr:uncharacterized protein PGTG_00798 [Puccinia graminis f. sp. tritici CRL 75-36-700-3]EFP75467.1 hypothetical protein PGTG_00798 [Puccinia graminis f. sp. tritici CRL 75-36-700-3]